jgi:hypothetical protein
MTPDEYGQQLREGYRSRFLEGLALRPGPILTRAMADVSPADRPAEPEPFIDDEDLPAIPQSAGEHEAFLRIGYMRRRHLAGFRPVDEAAR